MLQSLRAPPPAAPAGRGAFWGLWSGQLISNLGTQVSLYGVGLWLFEQHQRLGDFAAVAMVVQLAKLLALPLLGPRLAHWSRRRVMVLANGLGALSSLSLALLLLRLARVPLAAVLALQAVAAMGEAALVLCFATLIPELMPDGPERLRANGLFVTADGLVATSAPVLGAWLGRAAGLRGVLLLDALSFVVAMALVLLVRWPRTALRPAAASAPSTAPGASPGSWVAALGEIWRDRTLRPLSLLGAAMAFVYAAAEVLFPAWIAASFGSQRLGGALLVGALGFLVGYRLWRQLPAAAWGNWWCAALAAQALILIGAALVLFERLEPIWFAGLAGFSIGLPVALSALQTRWQQLVSPERMPPLFAARFSVEWGARLLAFALSGVVVDRLLRPALALLHGPLWLLEALGRGPGRPMAVGLGLMGWLLLLALWSQRRALAWRPEPAGAGKLGRCGS